MVKYVGALWQCKAKVELFVPNCPILKINPKLKKRQLVGGKENQ